ncbi:tetratricopeptide repeat protein [Algibacter pacificus]|uniref:tetratricopeptide repeat protein n=1 Tax=Algibacter pacificus TaxID=2599389 RepID=UPI0011CC6929|nr:hypothetical protein [Algibacter pacificus]
MCNKKYIANNIKNLLLITAFLLLAIPVFAHGDLSIQIAEKTKAITKSPNNFELYYERGLLYQQHVEYNKALNDYIKSESLGNTNNDLKYSMAEVYYLSEDYNKALKFISNYLEIDSINVKAKKLEAQILFNLKAYKKSLKAYRYVINQMVDTRPEDILEYSNIILAENPNNYHDALEAIDYGLKQLGLNTLSLQLKKLEYLEASNQVKKVLEQYNYFILQYKRKEFWYYKKAKYLQKINKPKDANIALQLAAISIEQLDAKFKNTNSIIRLQTQIKNLETTLN